MLGEDHADRRQLGDLMATEPPTRPLLLSCELSAAPAARIREVIDDLIHLIRRPVLTTSATVSGLSTRLTALTLPPRELLRLPPRLRPPLLTRSRRILRRRLGTRTRVLPSLLLQPPQAILVLRNAVREIENELNTRLTPRVIDRLRIGAVHACKIRCTNKESRNPCRRPRRLNGYPFQFRPQVAVEASTRAAASKAFPCRASLRGVTARRM
jgi:hypothetical protein